MYKQSSAEDEIVFVWSGRAENELGIGQHFEFALLDGSQAARSPCRSLSRGR
jgi:hypothetical protein